MGDIGTRIVFGLVIFFLSFVVVNNSAYANHATKEYDDSVFDIPLLNFDPIEIVSGGSSHDKDERYSSPTFGLDHENNQKIVDDGFIINEKKFSIDNNFYTPFAEQVIHIGEINSFEAKIYAEKGLKIQEFLFGIPKVGDAHLAEVGVEVWFGFDGEIQQVKAVQKSNVIDDKTLFATHEKTKCISSSKDKKCDLVKVDVTFLEPLKDNVIALKAIDLKNRYQITYLNEGIDIAGETLNPMKTAFIPSEIKGKGLIKVTQISKYSPYWISEDERLFEKNKFGSFKEINYQFERFHDDGDVRTRDHSSFGKILDYEKNRATKIFDANSLISDTPESFSYQFPDRDGRISEQLHQEMLDQEQIARKILEGNDRQARWY